MEWFTDSLISYSGKEDGFLLLESLTKAINNKRGTKYQLAWKVINVADYGVPQLRKRFFLVGHRDGQVFRFPDPTHLTFPHNFRLNREKKRSIERMSSRTTLKRLLSTFFSETVKRV